MSVYVMDTVDLERRTFKLEYIEHHDASSFKVFELFYTRTYRVGKLEQLCSLANAKKVSV